MKVWFLINSFNLLIIFLFMSHEIEADFVYAWENENSQCRRCSSFQAMENGGGFCTEAQAEVPVDAHCDFFQSVD